MKIRVGLFSLLRLRFGIPSLEIETERAVSMKELIDLAAAKIGNELTEQLLTGGAIRKGTLLLVDGRNVLLMEGLATMVDEHNEISFFPPSGGG